MLFELEPDETLTGGFTYNENKDFDASYVQSMLDTCTCRWGF